MYKHHRLAILRNTQGKSLRHFGKNANSQVSGVFWSEFLVIYVAAKAPLVKSVLQPLFLAAAMVRW